MDSLKKLHHCLYGEHFEIVTDQLSVKWLMSLQDSGDRLARRVLKIQSYLFTVSNAKGPLMFVPDTLSCYAVSKPLSQFYLNPLHGLKNEGGNGETI